MRFEVIGPDKQCKMSTEYPSCVYDVGVLEGMEAAGYTFKVNNKAYKAKAVHSAVGQDQSLPPKPAAISEPVNEPTKDIQSSLQPKQEPFTLKAARVGPFIVKWRLCKRAKAFDDLDDKQKKFTDYDVAEAFLNERAEKAGASYWAGGFIEDSREKSIYELKQ